MIRLPFIAANKEIVVYEIEDKVIRYYDKNWQNGIQIMPKSQSLLTAFKHSRNQSLKSYAVLIEEANSGQNLLEYNNAKSDEELAEIIRHEAKLNGLIEVKKNG